MDKIICVGKNYLKHAKELGDALNEEPILFIKPPSTLLVADLAQTPLTLPLRHEAHHEVELVFRIAKKNEEFTLSHYTFGLDLTLRDLQSSLKKAGQPWEKAKVFKNSSVVGAWQVMTSLEAVMNTPFTVSVNDEVRQRGLGTDMRWKPQVLLTDIVKWFPLCDGDLLFTGTPEGVGPLRPGDVVEVNGGGVSYSLKCLAPTPAI